MKLVTVWDYFMRRKGLLLMLVMFFSLSGLTSYQFFGRNQTELDVPNSGDPEVVDNYINIDEITEGDIAESEVEPSATTDEPVASTKVDGERNGIIIEPQHASGPRVEATVVDPMDDRDLTWQMPNTSDETAPQSETLETTEELDPKVKVETIAVVGGVVVALEIGARRLLRRYFPKED